MALKFYETPFHVANPVTIENDILKTELIIKIREVIHKRGLNTSDVVQSLRISKSQALNLLSGKIDEFTTCRLVSLLAMIQDY